MAITPLWPAIRIGPSIPTFFDVPWVMSRTRHHGAKAQRRIFGRNWHWLRNYPKWWDHEFHTKPRRAAERQAIDSVKRDPALGENALFPLDHKPHIYYW